MSGNTVGDKRNNRVAAFLSYSHNDNCSANDGILALADAIRSEYDLVTGEPLEIFIDSRSVEWGQEWRARIDGALAQTTFFIPVVTPRYFKSQECRREFVEFVSQAKSLHLEKLVLPILYVEVPQLNADNPDELVAQVARSQYADWRQLRLKDSESGEYRSAVHDLAMRLQQASVEIADTQIARELAPGADGEQLGIGEVLERINDLLQPWLDVVLANKVTQAQISATVTEYLRRLRRLEASGSPQSAVASTHLRLGPAILPLVEKARTESQTYLRTSLQLDPWMIMAGRGLRLHPEDCPMFRSVKDSLSEAIISIEEREGTLRHKHENGDAHFVMDHVEWVSHMSRTLGRAATLSRESGKNIDHGNEIVRRWWEDLETLIQ